MTLEQNRTNEEQDFKIKKWEINFMQVEDLGVDGTVNGKRMKRQGHRAVDRRKADWRRRLFSASRCAPPPGSTFQDEFQSRYRPAKEIPTVVPLAGKHKGSSLYRMTKETTGRRHGATWRADYEFLKNAQSISRSAHSKVIAETKNICLRATEISFPKGIKMTVISLSRREIVTYLPNSEDRTVDRAS